MKRERWMEGRKERNKKEEGTEEGRGPSDDLNVVNV